MIYRSAPFYELLMRILYGSGFEDRYRAVAREIPDGAEVLDLCSGDCRIYTRYLRPRNIIYLGLDSSPGFERHAAKHRIPFQTADLAKSEIPCTDYILLMSSLYQFYGEAESLLAKLLARARKKLILTEPITNLAQNPNPMIAKPAQWLSHSKGRFDENTLRDLVGPYGALIERMGKIAGGREMLVVFNCCRPQAA